MDEQPPRRESTQRRKPGPAVGRAGARIRAGAALDTHGAPGRERTQDARAGTTGAVTALLKAAALLCCGLVCLGLDHGESACVEGCPEQTEGDADMIRIETDVVIVAPIEDVFEQAKAMVKQGAVLIDVRMESEHKAGSIKGSINVPLFMLRLKAEGLDKAKTYICYCETGRRSSAAAYLLSEQGFESHVLQGGLQGIPRPG